MLLPRLPRLLRLPRILCDDSPSGHLARPHRAFHVPIPVAHKVIGAREPETLAFLSAARGLPEGGLRLFPRFQSAGDVE